MADPVALDPQVEDVVVAELAEARFQLIDLCPLSRRGYQTRQHALDELAMPTDDCRVELEEWALDAEVRLRPGKAGCSNRVRATSASLATALG